MFREFRICGMHRYGRAAFELGESFKLVREPQNMFDKNAIAVKDGTRTVTHVCRKDAAVLSQIIDGGFVINNSLYFKVKHDAEVKSRSVGPEHSGSVGFYYAACKKEELEALAMTLRLNPIWLNQ